MKAPREANELRKAVTNSLHDHPQKMYWIKTQFRGSPRNVREEGVNAASPELRTHSRGIFWINKITDLSSKMLEKEVAVLLTIAKHLSQNSVMNVPIDVSSILAIISTLRTGMMVHGNLDTIRVLLAVE